MIDVVRGDFAFDYATGIATTGGAPRQFLDPEISGEGTKVVLSNGKQVSWSRPPTKLNIPDWAEIEAIKPYFGRTDYHFFPCWLYHPSLPAVIVKDAQEAGSQYGVELVERTREEQERYGGGKYRWEFHGDWRVTPQQQTRPEIDTSRKELVVNRIDPIVELTKAIQHGRDGHVAGVDPELLQEFREFQAWKAQQRAAHEHDAESPDNGKRPRRG